MRFLNFAYLTRSINTHVNSVRHADSFETVSETCKHCAEGCEVFYEIGSHCHDHHIHVNPENFEIIAKIRNESHLKRLESLYQRTLKPKIINQC